MSDLVLYNYFRSSASYRVRIALHHKNLSFDYKPVHLLNNGGEQNTTQYRSLNPAGEVPTLIHQGKALSQSMAILEYLDENFSENPLFPKESFAKAKVIQFCEGINTTQSLQNLKVLQYLEKDFAASAEKKTAWAQHWILKNFEATEKMLEASAGKFCFGDRITAADVFLVPQIFAAQRFSVDPKGYPILNRINETCRELEAFQKAHPYKQIDTPDEFKKS